MSTQTPNWERLLDGLDAPPLGTVAEALADATGMGINSAYDSVEAAIENGEVVEDTEASAIGVVRLPDSEDSPDLNQQSGTEDSEVLVKADDVEATESSVDQWRELDFSTVAPRTWAPAQMALDSWMCRKQSKAPYAPWADADAPVGCTHEDHDEPTTCDKCNHHAGYKWGSKGSREYVHSDHETALEWADMHPSLSSDLAFIQREEDPFVFVDGDDVRDPETGDVHPVFEAFLEHLGLTYADVSTSGSGVHAIYRGEIPLENVSAPTFEIDSEPWGSNDETPAVEIYSGKHVCIATGDHVVGSGTEITDWDETAVEAILLANGFSDEPAASAERSIDLSDHTPAATGSDETTDDIRDVFVALDRLDPKRVGERTIVREWTHGRRSFLPTWGSSDDNGTANYINDKIWHDTGKAGGYGGPAVMAAIDAGLVNHAGATPQDVSGQTFFEALDHLRELGFSIPKLEQSSSDYNADAEPVATLPLEKLDALSPDEQKRAARKRGANIPSTREGRQRLRDGVFREIRAGNKTVLDAPTALGKSYTVASEPWLSRESTTGGAPVIHLHQTREARDEAAGASEETGVQYAVLLGRKEASPVARGDHDPTPDADEDPDIVVTIDGEPASEWFDRMCDGKGLPFSTALAIARQRNDQGLDELPPVGQEDPAVAQWDGLPRTDDGEPAVDVVHATHQFAHVPSIRAHTNVVIDEQPDFRKELSQDAIRRMVNAYLKEIDAPVSNFEAFVMLAENVGVGGDLGKERDALHSKLKTDREVSTEWFVENADAHALAPGITRAIWDAICWEDLDRNGRRSATVHHEPPRFDKDHDGYNAGLWLSVVVDDEHTVRTVRATPDFSNTRAVIGLDAHPSMPMWQLNADEGMTTDAVLDPEERRLWRRFERGLTTVQVGEATRPRSGEKALEWMNDQRVRTLLERIREHHGAGFKTALSTVQTERRVRELLADVAGPGVDDDNTMHFGEEKSRNDFADERAGYVYGCMDPGDEMILNAIAELGLDAAAPMVETDDGDLVREKGRTFEGRDADTADALLASVRENHVAQAAGRYARNADDPDSRATVYIHTDAAPSGFVDVEVGGVEWLATDLQRDVVATLSRRENATAKELAETVGCSKEHVRKTLERLEENGLVERDPRAGKHGADVYHGETDSDGEAVVDLGETANDRLLDPNRWSLVVCSPNARDTPPDRASTVGDDVGSDHTAGDTPPDWSLADD